jgi:hypothetical protein
MYPAYAVYWDCFLRLIVMAVALVSKTSRLRIYAWLCIPNFSLVCKMPLVQSNFVPLLFLWLPKTLSPLALAFEQDFINVDQFHARGVLFKKTG